MPHHVPAEETLPRPDLERLQRDRLAALLGAVRATNPFYQRKLANLDFDAARDPLTEVPLTTRAELQADQQQHPPFGSNLTYPLDRYTRFHQTSGSAGTPLRWLDTPESWEWWKKCWRIIFTASGVTPDDRVAYPFSFGPFIGFWSAFEAAASLGCLCLPAGGMSTGGRVRYMLDNEVTVVCCTPTYAQRLADVAAEEGLDLAGSPVRLLIVAGEPGGSIPAVRARLEQAWGARVVDHVGMTEMGAWGVEISPSPGDADAGTVPLLCVIESEFIPEVIDPESLAPVPDGEPGELVLTNLGRHGSPLIRYRTGDQVRLRRDLVLDGRHFACIEGGVLGRIDDMLVVRGNNVFPSSIENILRQFLDVVEFQIEVDESQALPELLLHIEPTPGADAGELARRVADAVRDQLHFRPIVRPAAPGSLPRFEMKARRVKRG